MTKTIFGKKLLMLATITVLVTGLTLAATFNDAEAKKAKNADVSVWDSSVPTDFVAGIFPITGAGQITGKIEEFNFILLFLLRGYCLIVSERLLLPHF